MIITRPLAAILLLVASAAPRAQSPGGADNVGDIGIVGQVLAPDGMPVSSGTVNDGGRVTTSIDRTGAFRLVPMRAGFLNVLVTVPGLAPYRLAVTVPASRSIRLPAPIRLEPAAYFRVRLVSPTGEPIGAPGIRHRSFDASGNGIADGIDERTLIAPGSDGALAIGPLPRGVMTLAVDNPFFAQTRLPDLKYDGSGRDVDGGTVVIQQPGAVLHVDVVDEAGAPVTDHDVAIEDTLPRSPLTFRPVRTDPRGRATFERLGPGRYRVSTSAVRRCANQVFLVAARVVPVPGTGTIETQLIAGGRAAVRITGPYGPMRGADVSLSPDALPVATLFNSRSTSPGCPGTTDEDGRVAFANVPPGPASVSVRTGSSTFVRQVQVSSGGPAIEVVVPDGFLPVRVLNGAKNEPVSGAAVTWTGSGARVEATTSITGEALLANVGTAAGTLAVSRGGYEAAQENFAEPPGILHEIALTPAPTPKTVRPRVIREAGDPVPDAVVEIFPADLSAIPRVAVTDAKGVVTFADVPRGSLKVIVGGDGFATSTTQAGEDQVVDIVLTPSR